MGNTKIIFLGTDNFPYGMAEVEKQILIARALKDAGCKIEFICKKSTNYNCSIPYKGNFLGINYFYTNYSSKRLHNKYINHFSWILGDIIEKLFLLWGKYDYAIVNSRDFAEIQCYAKLIHLKFKKIYLIYSEDARCMYSGKDPKKLRDLDNYEKHVWHIVDGAFPISEELSNQIKYINPSLPQFRIPVLVDLENVKNSIYNNPIDNEYFMFCGSAEYVETIDFILKGYLESHTNAKLLLVTSGTRKSIEDLQQKVQLSGKAASIIITSYLNKEELWGYYCNAIALLIPLNFNKRDQTRFPHKIGEYCAAGRPIITSNYGEIPFYFVDNENAILLNSNHPKELAMAMRKIQNNPILREKLGKGALKLAVDKFDYKIFGEKIIKFVNQQ